jgi:hypothetical protein
VDSPPEAPSSRDRAGEGRRGAPGTGREVPRPAGRWVVGRREAAFAGFLAFTYLPTEIEICFGFASSRFGITTRSSPSLNSALMLAVSTTFGSVNDRLNFP